MSSFMTPSTAVLDVVNNSSAGARLKSLVRVRTTYIETQQVLRDLALKAIRGRAHGPGRQARGSSSHSGSDGLSSSI